MWHRRLRKVDKLGSGDGGCTNVGDGGPESESESVEAVGDRALER